MKKTIVILAALGLAAAAWAQVVSPAGKYYVDGPTTSPTSGGVAQNATEQWLVENAGWRYATAQEIADHDAAQQDEAEAQAAYADPQPVVFIPRVSGSLTNIVGISQIFVASNGSIFAVDETGSPEKTLAQKQQQRDAQDAAKAANKAKRGTAKTNAAAANSVPALRAAVAQLIESME